jgi:hypothetical protein
MPLNLDLAVKITVPLTTLVLGKYLDRWLTMRPRLIIYLFHSSAFTMRTQNPATIHTHAIVIRNSGRVAANNIRIGHFVLPDNYQLVPSVPHEVVRTENGGAEIVIPKLVPGEQITISYLYFPPLLWSQIHAYTKSDEGYAKTVTVLPTPQYPKWITNCLWILIFIGASTLLYLVVELILRITQ